MNKGRNLLNAPLATGVRRHGFRKWYERELLSGHAHMVQGLLASIALLASFEAMSGGSLSEKLMNLGFAAVSAAICAWSLHRYLFLLRHAELIANQASCPACKEYGRFEVTAEDRREHCVQVRCRKCQSHWLIRE